MALTPYPLAGYRMEVVANVTKDPPSVVCDIKVKYKFEFKRLKGAFADIAWLHIKFK